MMLKEPSEAFEIFGGDEFNALRRPRKRSSGSPQSTRHKLSRDEKMRIEKRAREFAELALKTLLGYDQIRQEVSGNHGFDIEATRGGDILRVEVKGQRGSGASVTLTSRELQEYCSCKNPASEAKWELWHIVNLTATTTKKVQIVRYKVIPDTARTANSIG